MATKKRKSLKEFKNEEDRDKYINSVFEELGMHMLGSYESFSDPIPVIFFEGEYSGCEGRVSWDTLSKGCHPTFKSLSIEGKKNYIKKLCDKHNYAVVSIPERVTKDTKIEVRSPQGNLWKTSITYIEKGCTCPADSKSSWGERCISTILNDNNIPFTHLKRITNKDGSHQFMDFYLETPEGKFDIEYNGAQHYKEIKLFKYDSLKNQKSRDAKKRTFCKDNNIVYVEIPYTVDTPTEIAQLLKEYLPTIDTGKEYIVPSTNLADRDILDFYKTNTVLATATKFGISPRTVITTAKRYNFNKVVRRNPDLKGKQEVIDYFKQHTEKETLEVFNISKATLYRYQREINKRRSDLSQ